jgi:hypothetical protein
MEREEDKKESVSFYLLDLFFARHYTICLLHSSYSTISTFVKFATSCFFGLHPAALLF